ncbi:MAG: hypothetical protein HC836_29115 [Richelia sp. RM2_1_2]|nr:hypothetical protein [Richelia sp. SM2_1_7]NJM18310.1 hypothetical protein [Richelia sp. SM1_7_0]NJN08370.1 hypothetical protein [Richelia sp. RM1_1_1]NJO26913.1 hypothetical protein [Richelia sp. SL_2_1]NJO62146.1 hypothetical protein [Richelia sp. RM2_1_2]
MIAPFKKKNHNSRTNNQKSVRFSPQNKKTNHSRKKSRSFGEKFNLYTGEKLQWWQVIFRLAGAMIPAILPWIMLCSGYGFGVSIISYFGHFSIFTDNKVIQNIIVSLNIVLSLLLAFRTNTAHDRFWEGRKLWGAQVNVVRNLVRGIWVYIEERNWKDKSIKEAAMRLVVAFTIAMKLHLRRDSMNEELVPFMSSSQYEKILEVNHAPLEISLWLSEYLQNQYEREQLNVFQLNTLHQDVDEMIDILGGCERILKTPVPLIYTMTLKVLLLIYFLLLPWELVAGLNLWTSLVVGFISFVLLGINEIGAEIEEPFGHDPNDLPLDFICNTIKRNTDDLITFAPPQVKYKENFDRTA